MSRFREFRAYGTYGTPTTIDLEQVQMLVDINYNGRSGTEVHLTNGNKVSLSENSFDIRQVLNQYHENKLIAEKTNGLTNNYLAG